MDSRTFRDEVRKGSPLTYGHMLSIPTKAADRPEYSGRSGDLFVSLLSLKLSAEDNTALPLLKGRCTWCAL